MSRILYITFNSNFRFPHDAIQYMYMGFLLFLLLCSVCGVCDTFVFLIFLGALYCVCERVALSTHFLRILSTV